MGGLKAKEGGVDLGRRGGSVGGRGGKEADFVGLIIRLRARGGGILGGEEIQGCSRAAFARRKNGDAGLRVGAGRVGEFGADERALEEGMGRSRCVEESNSP